MTGCFLCGTPTPFVLLYDPHREEPVYLLREDEVSEVEHPEANVCTICIKGISNAAKNRWRDSR